MTHVILTKKNIRMRKRYQVARKIVMRPLMIVSWESHKNFVSHESLTRVPWKFHEKNVELNGKGLQRTPWDFYETRMKIVFLMTDSWNSHESSLPRKISHLRYRLSPSFWPFSRNVPWGILTWLPPVCMRQDFVVVMRCLMSASWATQEPLMGCLMRRSWDKAFLCLTRVLWAPTSWNIYSSHNV